LIGENANVVGIGKEAFLRCFSLRSFYFPLGVEVIGENCFCKCLSLHRLAYASCAPLRTLIGDLMLDEALERLELDAISNLSRIEKGRVSFEFPGCSPVPDENSHLTLVYDIP
jgi:hypothetical protein